MILFVLPSPICAIRYVKVQNSFFFLSMPNYDRALQSSLVISRESDFLNGDSRALKCQLSAERAAAFRMRNGTVFVVQKSKIFLHVGRVTFEQGLRSGEQETICSTYLNPREKLSLRNGKTNREAATDHHRPTAQIQLCRWKKDQDF